MDIDYLKIVTTIILAVIGWVIGHYFTDRRAISSKRREIVSEHLINAYRILTNEIAHREQIPERVKSLENILSDIQLFGSLEQVNLAKALADEVAAKKVFELDPLINSLRNDLRTELNLNAVAGNVKWLRFNE